jgi:hypothetical protein
MKGVKRFGMNGKLAPRYIGPFPILKKCGAVAYKLDLPPSLTGVHDIFHVSQLKKCLKAPVDVVLPEVTPLEADLSYAEHPIKILDQIVSQGVKQSSSSRYNGATTLKKKQLGKVRNSSVVTIQTSSCHSEGTCDCDTPRVTIAATMFYSTSATQATVLEQYLAMYFGSLSEILASLV